MRFLLFLNTSTSTTTRTMAAHIKNSKLLSELSAVWSTVKFIDCIFAEFALANTNEMGLAKRTVDNMAITHKMVTGLSTLVLFNCVSFLNETH